MSAPAPANRVLAPVGGVTSTATIPALGIHSHVRLRRRAQLMVLMFLVDVGLVTVASILAWKLRTRVDDLWAIPAPSVMDTWQPAVGPGLIMLWVVTLLLMGAYRTRRFGAGFEELRALTLGSVIAVCLSGFLAYLVKSELSRGYLLLMFIFGTTMLLTVRYAERKTLHHLRIRGRLLKRVVAVGSTQAVAELDAVLRREPWTGYRLIGMCTPQQVDHEPPVPVLGTIADMRGIVQANHVDAILVAGGTYSSAAELRNLGWDIEGLGLDLLVVPSLTDVAGPRIHFSHVAGLPLVHVEEPQGGQALGLGKRLFDVVLSCLLVVLLSPVMLAIALAVKLQDGGPVFYRQRRVGSAETTFEMIKFRSMVVEAEYIRSELEGVNESDGLLFKIREDPRVTTVGRFLRKFSLDELPQLFNVIAGEMSLVGPRPPLPDEVASYDEEVYRRLRVRPGMTGLWQVSGRSDLSWEESVRLDLYYIDNWSMTSDVGIMFKTVRAVLLPQGAY